MRAWRKRNLKSSSIRSSTLMRNETAFEGMPLCRRRVQEMCQGRCAVLPRPRRPERLRHQGCVADAPGVPIFLGRGRQGALPSHRAQRGNGRPAAYLCASLGQEHAQHATMAPSFVRAIAADGEVCRTGQGGQQIERTPGLLACHLGAKAPHEGRPFSLGPRRQAEREGARARRKDRKPYVVPIVGGEAALRDAARRPAHGSDAQALAAGAPRTEPDDAHCHDRGECSCLAAMATPEPRAARTSSVKSIGVLEPRRPPRHKARAESSSRSESSRLCTERRRGVRLTCTLRERCRYQSFPSI